MTTHFNIGKKVEINPFEGVNYVRLAENSLGKNLLKRFLDKHSESVSTVKINDEWNIVYSIAILDFTTLLTWIAPYRGKFLFPTNLCNHTIHFRIEDNTMICW